VLFLCHKFKTQPSLHELTLNKLPRHCVHFCAPDVLDSARETCEALQETLLLHPELAQTAHLDPTSELQLDGIRSAFVTKLLSQHDAVLKLRRFLRTQIKCIDSSAGTTTPSTVSRDVVDTGCINAPAPMVFDSSRRDVVLSEWRRLDAELARIRQSLTAIAPHALPSLGHTSMASTAPLSPFPSHFPTTPMATRALASFTALASLSPAPSSPIPEARVPVAAIVNNPAPIPRDRLALPSTAIVRAIQAVAVSPSKGKVPTVGVAPAVTTTDSPAPVGIAATTLVVSPPSFQGITTSASPATAGHTGSPSPAKTLTSLIGKMMAGSRVVRDHDLSPLTQSRTKVDVASNVENSNLQFSSAAVVATRRPASPAATRYANIDSVKAAVTLRRSGPPPTLFGQVTGDPEVSHAELDDSSLCTPSKVRKHGSLSALVWSVSVDWVCYVCLCLVTPVVCRYDHLPRPFLSSAVCERRVCSLCFIAY
jgi:hypothetical protein